MLATLFATLLATRRGMVCRAMWGACRRRLPSRIQPV